MASRKQFIAAGLITSGLLVSLLLILAAGTALAAVTSQSPAALPVVDDFEGGMPAGWFSYGDYGSGTAIATTVVATDTVPGAAAGNHALEIAYTSAGWGAGTGKNLGGQDWSLYDGLAFWFRGTASGGVYRVILSDNPNPAVPGDSAERFAYEFKDDAAGWRTVLIPWGAFFRDPGYQPGGAPNDGLTLTQVQAYALALPAGARTAYMDDVRLVKFQNVDDFESGMPAGWFSYGDYGSGSAIATNVVTTDTVPGAPAGNHALEIAYTSAGWGAGTGKNLPGPDWTPYSGFSFWFFGSNSGGVYRVILSDNPNPAVPGDSAERFAYEFSDNAAGWRYVAIPWAAFFRDPGYQPGGAPNDGLTLTQVQAYALALPNGTRTTYLDHVALFGAGQIPVTVGFDPQTYTVTEGDAVTLTVALNVASDQPITVTWATANGTAQAGSDYTAASGQLVFAPDETTKTVAVQTINDTATEDAETFTVALSAPQGASLGSKATATVTIPANDQPVGNSVIVDSFEDGALPSGVDANGISVGFVTWNAAGAAVAITVTDAPPAAVPDAVAGNKTLKLDLTIGAGQWAGYTHAFTNDAANQWLSQDWSSYEGLSLWLYGNNTGGALFVDVQDNRNPGSTTDDAERWSADVPDNFTGWKFIQLPFTSFHRKDIGNGAPNDGFNLTEVHGYAVGGYGSVPMGSHSYFVDEVTIYGKKLIAKPQEAQFEFAKYTVAEGASLTMTVTLSIVPTQTVTVRYATMAGTAVAGRAYTPLNGTLIFAPDVKAQSITLATMSDGKYAPDRLVFVTLSDPTSAVLGGRKEAQVTIAEATAYDPALLDDFETYPYLWRTQGNVVLATREITAGAAMALPGQGAYENVLQTAFGAAQAVAAGDSMAHPFAIQQDWRSYNGLSLWYYGQNTGQSLTVQLLGQRAADPGKPGWVQVWSDEFNDPAGAPPNSGNWSHELGDGKLNGNLGWGNNELEYYTDSADNAAADGQGNLVITARKINTATTTLACYYGPCEYTSARLISANKAEFAHGRIEARIQTPYGQGLWPAFWMLGNDISRAGWPQAGEIDIMENVGKEPAIAHGTVHGPGYSGGAGIGAGYALPSGQLSDDFHVFAVEWEQGRIRWFIDNTNYFTVTTSSIPAGKEWVFEHPFYLLLNVAVGGGWPGNPDDTTAFPQTMKVDYVRVYQGPDTAERFAMTFTDNFAGWQKVLLPFRSFTRAATQPAGAPNDGLTLSQMWGYGFGLPQDANGTAYLDQVRLADLRIHFMPLIVRR